MPKLNGRIPRYRLHKVSGQAIVTLNASDHYLGPHGSSESNALYDRLIGQWLSQGRQKQGVSSQQTAPASLPPQPQRPEMGRTVDHVIHAFGSTQGSLQKARRLTHQRD